QPLQVHHGARARALTHRKPPDRFVTTALLQPDVIRRQRRDVLGLLLVQQPQRAVQRTRHVIEQFLGVRKLLGHRSDEIIQAVMHVLRRPHLAEGLVVIVLRQILTDLAHAAGVTLRLRNQVTDRVGIVSRHAQLIPFTSVLIPQTSTTLPWFHLYPPGSLHPPPSLTTHQITSPTHCPRRPRFPRCTPNWPRACWPTSMPAHSCASPNPRPRSSNAVINSRGSPDPSASASRSCSC